VFVPGRDFPGCALDHAGRNSSRIPLPRSKRSEDLVSARARRHMGASGFGFAQGPAGEDRGRAPSAGFEEGRVCRSNSTRGFCTHRPQHRGQRFARRTGAECERANEGGGGFFQRFCGAASWGLSSSHHGIASMSGGTGLVRGHPRLGVAKRRKTRNVVPAQATGMTEKRVEVFNRSSHGLLTPCALV